MGRFVLATPVVLWAAYPFHWSAALNARHGAATMDTLVSLGVGAAYLWSIVQLLRFGWLHAQHEVYFEVAAVVTTFILAGHFWRRMQNGRPARPCAHSQTSAPRTSRFCATGSSRPSLAGPAPRRRIHRPPRRRWRPTGS